MHSDTCTCLHCGGQLAAPSWVESLMERSEWSRISRPYTTAKAREIAAHLSRTLDTPCRVIDSQGSCVGVWQDGNLKEQQQ